MANWKYRIDLKDIWKMYDEEEIHPVEAAKMISQKLKEHEVYKDHHEELDSIIDEIEGSETEEEINASMQSLYDWADSPLPTVPGKMQRKMAWIATMF